LPRARCTHPRASKTPRQDAESRRIVPCAHELYICERVEEARVGRPALETRRGMVPVIRKLSVDAALVLCFHEKYTRRKNLQLLDACPHAPPWKVRSIVGCVIHARTAQPAWKGSDKKAGPRYWLQQPRCTSESNDPAANFCKPPSPKGHTLSSSNATAAGVL